MLFERVGESSELLCLNASLQSTTRLKIAIPMRWYYLPCFGLTLILSAAMAKYPYNLIPPASKQVYRPILPIKLAYPQTQKCTPPITEPWLIAALMRVYVPLKSTCGWGLSLMEWDMNFLSKARMGHISRHQENGDAHYWQKAVWVPLFLRGRYQSSESTAPWSIRLLRPFQSVFWLGNKTFEIF